jgi:hypothetical protein
VGERVVELAVQRAEVSAVGGEAERAGRDPLDRVHGVHDVEDADRLGRARQHPPAADAALRPDEAGPAQRLEHLREVAGRHAGLLRDPAGDLRLVRAVRQRDHRPQGVLGRL